MFRGSASHAPYRLCSVPEPTKIAVRNTSTPSTTPMHHIKSEPTTPYHSSTPTGASASTFLSLAHTRASFSYHISG